MLLSSVEYLDSQNPLRTLIDLPEPLKLNDASFDCFPGAIHYFSSSSILESQLLNLSGEHKQRKSYRSVQNVLHDPPPFLYLSNWVVVFLFL